MGLLRTKVNGYVIKPGTKLAVLVAFLSVGLAGCSNPPSPGSLAIDRAGEIVGALLAAPDDAQIAMYKRELLANYQTIGIPMSEDSIDEAMWTAMISASLKTCRELAGGVSETDMRDKMIDDLKQQEPGADPTWYPLIAEVNLTAIQAPGSLCP